MLLFFLNKGKTLIQAQVYTPQDISMSQLQTHPLHVCPDFL